MAENVRKKVGKLNAIVVLTFVVLLVILLMIQTWPNIVAAAHPEQDAAVRGGITLSPSPSPSGDPTPFPMGGE